MRKISIQFALMLLCMGLVSASGTAQAGVDRELDHYGYGAPIYVGPPVRLRHLRKQQFRVHLLRSVRPFHRIRLSGPRDLLVIPGPRLVPEHGPRFGWFTHYGSIYSELLIVGAWPNWVSWTRNVQNGFGYATAYRSAEPLVEFDAPLFRRP